MSERLEVTKAWREGTGRCCVTGESSSLARRRDALRLVAQHREHPSARLSCTLLKNGACGKVYGVGHFT